MENKKQIIYNLIDKELTTLPLSLDDYLKINDKKLNTRLKYNEIQQYIDKFIEGNKSYRFNVMPGLRGVGKTTILYQIYNYLLNEKTSHIHKFYTFPVNISTIF